VNGKHPFAFSLKGMLRFAVIRPFKPVRVPPVWTVWDNPVRPSRALCNSRAAAPRKLGVPRGCSAMLRGSPPGTLRGPIGVFTCTAPPGAARQGRRAVRRELALPKDTPAQYRRCWVGTMWRAAPAQCQGVQVSRSSGPLGSDSPALAANRRV